jgi:hypothetical protein
VSLAGARLIGIVDRCCLRVAHNDGERYGQGVLANLVERPRPRRGLQRPAHTAWILGALAQLRPPGFAVAGDGPRPVADARGLACKVSPGGSVQCVARQVVRTGERAGTSEVCLAERVGFVSSRSTDRTIFEQLRG